jgi:hypothetical protein
MLNKNSKLLKVSFKINSKITFVELFQHVHRVNLCNNLTDCALVVTELRHLCKRKAVQLLFLYYFKANALPQWYINLGHQVAQATRCCTVAYNICGSSVWNFLHVVFLAQRILMWITYCRKICAPLQ